MAIDCPYGASDCPKINSLESMVEKNGQDLAQLRKEVTQLSTTLKNASYLITTIVSILIAIIGVVKI